MNENEFDYYFAGISWGECFDILSPYQKRLDYDFETMEINKNEKNWKKDQWSDPKQKMFQFFK